MFTFKGVTSTAMGVIERSVTHSILPPINHRYVKYGTRDGAFDTGRSFGMRTIEVVIGLSGTSYTDLRAKARNVAEWLNSDKPESLIFSDEPDKQYFARVVDTTELEETLYYGEATITFICPDPFAEGLTLVRATLPNDNQTSLTVDGTTKVYPKITLKPTASMGSIVLTRYSRVSLAQNYAEKVTASNIENPHLAKYSSTQLSSISTTSITQGTEYTQSSYDNIKTQDTTTFATTSTSVNGAVPVHIYTFDIVEALERLGYTIPANTRADKATWVKNNVDTVNFNAWCYAGANGVYGVQIKKRIDGTWADSGSSTGSTITMIGSSMNGWEMETDGKAVFMIHGLQPSNGTFSSQIWVDYVSISIRLKLRETKMTLVSPFVSGDTVVIDSKSGKVSLNGSVQMNIVSLDSEFPVVEAGTNYFTLTTNVNGTIEYFPRWL
jgi:predicted phage tail component-like protein